MKTEVIIIRINAELKEKFKTLCEKKNETMSRVLIEQIKKITK